LVKSHDLLISNEFGSLRFTSSRAERCPRNMTGVVTWRRFGYEIMKASFSGVSRLSD